MFKQRFLKFRGELKDEAKRIGTRLKEELLESEDSEAKEDNKLVAN